MVKLPVGIGNNGLVIAAYLVIILVLAVLGPVALIGIGAAPIILMVLLFVYVLRSLWR